MWKKFDQIPLMLELARHPMRVALIKERSGEVKYRMLEKEAEGEFSPGNFELNVVIGLTQGKGLEVYFDHGEFFFKLHRKTEVLPEVVDIREMEYNGRKRKVPICVIEDTLYPDINSLAMRLFSEVNQVTLKQTFSWAAQFNRATRKFPGGEVKFRLSDFEMMGPHISTRGNRSGYSFLHSKLGFISGLGELRNHFPDLTPKQVRSIYHNFEIPPSTNIMKLWGPKAREDLFKSLCKKHKLWYDQKAEAVMLGNEPTDSEEIANTTKIQLKEAEKLWEWVKENGPRKNGKSTSKT